MNVDLFWFKQKVKYYFYFVNKEIFTKNRYNEIKFFFVIDEVDLIFDLNNPLKINVESLFKFYISTSVKFAFFSSIYDEDINKYLETLRPSIPIEKLTPNHYEQYYNTTTHWYTLINNLTEINEFIKTVLTMKNEVQTIIFCKDNQTINKISSFLNSNGKKGLKNEMNSYYRHCCRCSRFGRHGHFIGK